MPSDLDPVIHQRVRLRLMTLLHKNRAAPFAWLVRELDITPGNLDNHARRLADAGYVEYGRQLTPRGFENRVRITARGDAAFLAYRHALLALLDASDAGAPRES